MEVQVSRAYCDTLIGEICPRKRPFQTGTHFWDTLFDKSTGLKQTKRFRRQTKNKLPDRELNPGLPRDRRGY
jgi:hypothetical protein